MRRSVNLFVSLIVFAMAAGLGAAALDVAKARQQTPALLDAALAEARGPAPALPPALPPERLAALLAVKDPTFFGHRGTAFGAGTKETISQTLARRLYGEGPIPVLDPVRHALLARFALDAKAAKAEQLTLYLRTVRLGQGPGGPVTGIAAAAQAYWSKPLAALSDDEFYGLLTLLADPERYHPAVNAKAHAAMKRRIAALAQAACARAGLNDDALMGCVRPS